MIRACPIVYNPGEITIEEWVYREYGTLSAYGIDEPLYEFSPNKFEKNTLGLNYLSKSIYKNFPATAISIIERVSELLFNKLLDTLCNEFSNLFLDSSLSAVIINRFSQDEFDEVFKKLFKLWKEGLASEKLPIQLFNIEGNPIQRKLIMPWLYTPVPTNMIIEVIQLVKNFQSSYSTCITVVDRHNAIESLRAKIGLISRQFFLGHRKDILSGTYTPLAGEPIQNSIESEVLDLGWLNTIKKEAELATNIQFGNEKVLLASLFEKGRTLHKGYLDLSPIHQNEVLNIANKEAIIREANTILNPLAEILAILIPWEKSESELKGLYLLLVKKNRILTGVASFKKFRTHFCYPDYISHGAIPKFVLCGHVKIYEIYKIVEALDRAEYIDVSEFEGRGDDPYCYLISNHFCRVVGKELTYKSVKQSIKNGKQNNRSFLKGILEQILNKKLHALIEA